MGVRFEIALTLAIGMLLAPEQHVEQHKSKRGTQK
jgi:hypothetical protein